MTLSSTKIHRLSMMYANGRTQQHCPEVCFLTDVGVRIPQVMTVVNEKTIVKKANNAAGTAARVTAETFNGCWS